MLGAGRNTLTLLFFGLFAFSLFVSFLSTRMVRDVATRRGWVSPPRDGRHLHQSPLPRLGGVAIFLAFSVSLAVWLGLSLIFPRLVEGSAPSTLLRIYIPACLIFCLGIYDDLKGAGPYLKFSVQAVAAGMLFAGGMRVLDLPLIFGSHSLPWFIGLPLTILWVVAVTNAFNLIDGLDGLAAGSALFSTMVVFVVSLVDRSWLGSLMSVTLAGAILGFLRFNFNPATIFLGDSGSLFIGFMLSALALAGAAADSFPMTAPDRVSLVFEPNEEELRVKAAALGCHESQLQPFLRRTLADPGIFALWGPEGYIRIGSDEAESRVAPSLFPELG